MLTVGGAEVYEPQNIAYNGAMRGAFTIGDVIRKARKDRKWDQERLGAEAVKFQITGREKKINKATISKIEGANPYTSEFGVVWRVLAALGLSFADIEQRIGSPFLEHREAPTKTSMGRRRA